MWQAKGANSPSRNTEIYNGDRSPLIKPSDVALALAQPRASVFAMFYRGLLKHRSDRTVCRYHADHWRQTLRSRITLAAANELKLLPGYDVYALLKSSGLVELTLFAAQLDTTVSSQRVAICCRRYASCHETRKECGGLNRL